MNDGFCDCHVTPVAPRRDAQRAATALVRLRIDGMGCANCAVRVQNAIVRLDGVGAAFVSLYPPVATVRYDPRRLTSQDLLNAVAQAGAPSRHCYCAQVVAEL